jgi:cell fate (sporulation/competence/biofilm development) regulator YlbF (YheA/YmcA/DUF963 family)
MEEDNMIISKMAEKSKIKDLDTDAKEEVDGYIDKLIDMALEKVPKKHKDMVERAVRNEIGDRFIVRNTRFQGEVSPKTGKNYSLIHPSPQLGYETEAEADKRVKEMNKAGEISRARAEAKRKTVNQMESEITEEVVEEIMEEIVQSNSKLSELFAELRISFGARYPQRQNYSKSRGFLDEDLNRIEEMVESQEGPISREDLKSFQEFIQKVKPNNTWSRFVAENQKMTLEKIMDMMVQKLNLNKSVWKSTLKKSRLSSFIDEVLNKLSTDTFEKDYIEG